MTNLAQYMEDNLHQLVQVAYRGLLNNPREARFALQLQKVFTSSNKRRTKIKSTRDIDVPPYLIASIATTCNLQCKGCYARNNGIAANDISQAKHSLTADQWRTIFDDAAQCGISVALLAGGEPLTRRDVLEQAAQNKKMLFPVFTNGTLLASDAQWPTSDGKTTTYADFFSQHLNLIPVISLEGDLSATDNRRGAGVYKMVTRAMERMQEKRLFFGVSLTVTTENMHQITSHAYVDDLRDKGCRIVFYVEYVPIAKDTEHLALTDSHVEEMERTVEQLRNDYPGMIFVSFPGDEKLLDGCMAAGRGFFHIGPDGAAEPCPFSNHSDTNVFNDGVLNALQSPLFTKIRSANMLNWHHTGGCTLYEHRDEVEAMLQEK